MIKILMRQTQEDPQLYSLPPINAWEYGRSENVYDSKWSLTDEVLGFPSPTCPVPLWSPLSLPSAGCLLPTWLDISSAATTLQRFIALNGVVSALREYHNKDILHGNLTQDSISITQGEAVLSPDTQASLAGLHEITDILGARWAASNGSSIATSLKPTLKLINRLAYGCKKSKLSARLRPNWTRYEESRVSTLSERGQPFALLGQSCLGISSATSRQPLQIRVSSSSATFALGITGSLLFDLTKGDVQPTKMSDVYSFGCIMLQVLTGKVPHCGTTRIDQVVYLKYLGEEPIDNQTPHIEDRYVVFMRQCWDPVPQRRPTIEAVGDFIRKEMKRLVDPL